MKRDHVVVSKDDTPSFFFQGNGVRELETRGKGRETARRRDYVWITRNDEADSQVYISSPARSRRPGPGGDLDILLKSRIIFIFTQLRS